jgi:hypothetical protein
MVMATPDPIKPVIDALSTVFAVPSGTPGDPASYKAGTATVPNPGVVGAITALMQALYSASSDMNDVGTAIKTALTDVAKVIVAIADQVVALSSVTDVANAMGQLQQGLTLAQTLAPTGPVAVLNSAGTLFQQIQNLLAATGDPKTAAIELYSLAQQLNQLAIEIKP